MRSTDRIKVMTEHLTNVQHELVSTQQLVDGKKKEVDTEEHMEALAKRQIGRLVAEMRRLKGLVEDYQDRTNSSQNEIFRGNENLDQFKLQMNWNQEELEQWSLAARQKEEDELTLEKYKRADEAKIRELMLAQEQLTVENAKKKNQLQTDRKNLISQWEDAVKNMQTRDKQLETRAQKYAEELQRKRQQDQKLQEKRRYHEKTVQENEKVQQAITETDRELARNRVQFVSVRDGLHEFQDEVEVLKNQLAAAAHEQVSLKNELVSSSQGLEDRKLRYSEMQRKLAGTERRFSDEQLATKSAEEKADLADKFYQETELRLKQAEKTMKTVKDELFKQSR